VNYFAAWSNQNNLIFFLANATFQGCEVSTAILDSETRNGFLPIISVGTQRKLWNDNHLAGASMPSCENPIIGDAQGFLRVI
jgi:hypothetical protein